MTEAFPLQWPTGKPRTRYPEYSRFSPGNRAQEVANVRDEIYRLGGKNIVVSTNVRLRRDGLPYASDKAPADQGVAVYFNYRGGQKCFACDRWATVEENLRAIFKSIEAIRSLDRWGSKDFVDAAFTGFAALPPPMVVRQWWQVLGVSDDASADEIHAAYRKKAMEIHQRGGSDDEMSELNVARDQGAKERA